MQNKKYVETVNLANTLVQIDKLVIDLLDIREMRWPNTRTLLSDNYIVYYTEKDEPNRYIGVGSIV